MQKQVADLSSKPLVRARSQQNSTSRMLSSFELMMRSILECSATAVAWAANAISVFHGAPYNPYSFFFLRPRPVSLRITSFLLVTHSIVLTPSPNPPTPPPPPSASLSCAQRSCMGHRIRCARPILPKA